MNFELNIPDKSKVMIKTVPTMEQIKSCKNNDKLRSYREFLFSNLNTILSEVNKDGIISFEEWENLICHIDSILHNTEPYIYLWGTKEGKPLKV